MQRAPTGASRRAPTSPITPLPIPARELRGGGARTILLFGGSFDPPHSYHTLGPQAALKRLYGNEGWLLYVPAAQSPLKDAASASAVDRVAMLRLALGVPRRCSIWTDEIDRAAWYTAHNHSPPPSYTIDSVRRLRSVLLRRDQRRIELRLLIGSDQAADFHRWRDARTLLRIAPPLIMLRKPIDTPAALFACLESAGFWTPAELRQFCASIAPTEVVPVASTRIRAAIRRIPASAGASDKHEASAMLDAAVARYIIEHKLYDFHAATRPRSSRGSGYSAVP